jgi:OmpA-OmpF porin, OOP family
MFYTRFYTVIILSLLSGFSLAQSNIQTENAIIEGFISDFNQKAKTGETILFENIQLGSIRETISDENGKFRIELPYDQTYLIKIQGIGFEQDYAELTIPALGKDQSGLSYELEIQIELPRTFTLNNVYFETGSASLTSDSFAELKDLLEYMQLKKSTVIEIAGHTDNVGQPESNLLLSQRRAESVRDYLLRNGIERHRIAAKGYGEEQPVAANETAEGRMANRRTEVRILAD